MVRFARHLLEANISMKNVPERISRSFTTAVPQVYVLPPGSTAFENVNGRETPMDFSMDSRIPLTRSILQDVPISSVPGARGYPDVTFVLRKHYAPLTPAPSVPGPSVPGPSVPGPSVPGTSAPGPSTHDPLTPSVAPGPLAHSLPSTLPPPNGPALQSIYQAVVAALKAAPLQSSHPAPVPGHSRITSDQLANALSRASLDPERGEDIENPVKALSRLSRPLRIESKLEEFLRVPIEFKPVITNPFPRLHPKPFENPIPFKEDRPLRVLAVDLPSHRVAFWKGTTFPTWSVEVQLPQEDYDWVSRYWPSGIKIVKSLEEGQYVCQAWCWVRFHGVFVLVYNDRFTVTGRFGIKE